MIFIDKKRILFILPLLIFFIYFILKSNLTLNTSVNIKTTENKTSIQVPIIMYHSISENKNDKYIIKKSDLEADIQYILNKGYTPVFISDLINYVCGKDTLPKKPIVLTFDDGYYNNFLYLFPIAEKYEIKAVISIIGIHSEIYSSSNDLNPNYAHIPWENIKEMKKSGYIEIQNHSYDMHTTQNRKGSSKIKGESEYEYKEKFIKDTEFARKKLIKECGIYTTCYTYPFGAITEISEKYLKEMGFKASLSCYEGINEIRNGDYDCLFQLKRYNRSGNENREKFMGKLGL